jgi:hypothetical protein
MFLWINSTLRRCIGILYIQLHALLIPALSFIFLYSFYEYLCNYAFRGLTNISMWQVLSVFLSITAVAAGLYELLYRLLCSSVSIKTFPYCCIRWTSTYLGFEVLTAVVMKITIFYLFVSQHYVDWWGQWRSRNRISYGAR